MFKKTNAKSKTGVLKFVLCIYLVFGNWDLVFPSVGKGFRY
jgi:hypothetical protein